MSKKNYKLDPAWYYDTSLFIAWDAALKITGVDLEPLTDPDRERCKRRSSMKYFAIESESESEIFRNRNWFPRSHYPPPPTKKKKK